MYLIILHHELSAFISLSSNNSSYCTKRVEIQAIAFHQLRMLSKINPKYYIFCYKKTLSSLYPFNTYHSLPKCTYLIKSMKNLGHVFSTDLRDPVFITIRFTYKKFHKRFLEVNALQLSCIVPKSAKVLCKY